MVLCLLALPVLAFLGIFSVKYRKLTLDSLDCLFRTVTLRKCRSGLDDKMRADVSGTVLKYSPTCARFVYKHYKVLSWIILVIFIWSFYASSVGLYNYYNYGNCNGPDETGFCVFDPTGSNSKIAEIVYPELGDDDPIIGPEDAELTIIEFGCYACPFTKKAEPIINQVIDYYDGKVNFEFKSFLIPHHNESYESALAAECAKEQGMYMDYHTALFAMREYLNHDEYLNIARQIGLDVEEFEECLDDEKYKKEVESDALMGLHAHVAGTPTFFVNEQKIVGPKPFRTFKKIINKELD